jgi:hypothetical protein
MDADDKVSPLLVTESLSADSPPAAGDVLALTDPEVTGQRYVINHAELDPRERSDKP